jgi:hypothetical protein
MRRKIVLLAACLVVLVCGMVNAQYPVGGEVILLNPPDSLVYGTSYTFDFAINNNTELGIRGSTNGFEIYSDNGAGYTLVVDEDKWRSVMATWYSLGQFISYFGGGGNPDTVGFGGAMMAGAWPVPAGAFLQAISFTVTFDDVSSGATQFCIDTCWYPPGGQWLWAMSDGTQRIPVADWAGTCWNLCQPICGDVNGDLVVSIADMTFMADYLFSGGRDPVSQEAADVNCDGSVNIMDLTYLIKYLFDGGPAPCADCP